MLIILFAKLLLCLFKVNEKDRQQYFSGKIFEQVRFFFRYELSTRNVAQF